MNKKLKFFIINIGIPVLFLIFSPYITKVLCSFNRIEINLPIKVVDKETKVPVLCEVTCERCEDVKSRSKIAQTNEEGMVEFMIKTNFSSYPGCPDCFDFETITIQILKNGEVESYNLPIQEYSNINPSTVTLNYPR